MRASRKLKTFMIALTINVCLSLRKNHVIHWNTSNPIFRIDNTDHIMDVNKDNLPTEYDQVNIICPNYEGRGGSKETGEEEKYIIYSVSKDEYETCKICGPNPKIVAMCDKPKELLYFTLSFRSFTPIPGGMEFQPGKDYYFISTSSPEDLKGQSGGRCRTHNMKVVFKVANRPSQRKSNPETFHRYFPLSINTPRKRRPPSSTTYEKLHSSTADSAMKQEASTSYSGGSILSIGASTTLITFLSTALRL